MEKMVIKKRINAKKFIDSSLKKVARKLKINRIMFLIINITIAFLNLSTIALAGVSLWFVVKTNPDSIKNFNPLSELGLNIALSVVMILIFIVSNIVLIIRLNSRHSDYRKALNQIQILTVMFYQKSGRYKDHEDETIASFKADISKICSRLSKKEKIKLKPIVKDLFLNDYQK